MKNISIALLCVITFSACGSLQAGRTGNAELIKDCPEEKIVNRMPGPPAKGDKDKSYYIYKGKRKKISDFDANWIEKNCEVKETVVY
jgi:hypothetical protein